jgi:transposase-like protein
MRRKLRASEQKSKVFAAMMEREGADALESMHQLGQEKVYQEMLEAEVDEFLGRKWHKWGKEGSKGHRNGYYRRRVKVPGYRLQVSVPCVRGVEKPFVSKVLGRIVQLAERVKTLALEMYVRGLSTRDIEEAFQDGEGKPLFGRSSISRIAERLYEEYLAFSRRDLSRLDVVFLFVDGVYESVKRYTNGQALLCAWAICSNGRKEFLHLMPVQSESQEAWEMFFEDLRNRGLRQPLLVISDGAPGLLNAIDHHFPHADRQRCIAHKLRNIAQKLPRDVAEAILAEFKAVYYAADRSSADLLAEQLIDKYAQAYPSAVSCFIDDLDACLTHLKYPEGHRRYIRTTNLLERTFVEEKRRTKIIPQHQHERGAVGLVFGVLYRAARHWQRVSMTQLELAQLRNIRALICPGEHDPNFISYRPAA